MNRCFLTLAVLAGLSSLRAQTVLNPGQDVQAAVNSAAPGSTLVLNPGTYNLAGTLVITKSVALRSSSAGSAVLQFPINTIVGIDIKSSDVTIDGVRIVGSSWGIYAGQPSGTAFSNVTIRNVSVNANGTNANAGHGIYVNNIPGVVVDSNTIEFSHVTGILVDAGSNTASVTNNLISNAGGHGIGITNTDNVLVAGNTVAGANDFGIILQASKFSRVERNVIQTGVKQDGIVVTRNDTTGVLSQSNYIGKNTVTSNQLAAGNPNGTGIWLNSQSNGTLVYGNITSGAPENGLTIFNSSNNHLWGNVTSNNGHGGIYIFGPTNLPYSTGPAPSYTVLDGNIARDLPTNAGVNLDLSTNSTVFNNFLTTDPVGIYLQQTSGNQVYLNMLRDNTQGVHATSGATATNYFLNRHLTALTAMPNYADAGSSVTFDGGPVFGGNYQIGGKVLSDQYRYFNEQLGRQPSISVLLPAAGTIAGVGTRKTIEWHSTACTYVDISYRSAGTGTQPIATNYPDVGIYHWTVPSTAPASDYSIVLACKNSANISLGVTGTSSTFTIAPAGLELLSPQGNHRIDSGGTARVAWKRSPGTTGSVDVYYRSTPAATPVVLVSGVIANNVLVNVPAGASSQASFVIRVSATPSVADSTDGFVDVASTTPSVSGPSGTIGIGTLQLLQWSSHQNAAYVDLEYWDPAANTFRPLVSNVPDFGRFYFLVPDKTMTNSYVRVRFKSAAGATLTTANSGTFSTAVAAAPGSGGGTAATPDPVSVSPATGSGTSQTFTVTYTDDNGGSDIALAYFMVNPAITGINSCFIEYNRSANSFRLMNDAGNTWSAPVASGSGSTSNTYCSFTGAGAGATVSGNDLVLTFPLTFTAAAAGARNAYALAIDNGSLNSGWKALGMWTVPSTTPPNSLPDVTSLTPVAGSGTSGIFTAVFRHPGGATKHYLGYILFLPLPNVVSFNAQGTCLIEYNRISNGMRLINNAGDNWIGPIEGVPVIPSTPPLSNNACTVNVAGAAVSLVGTDMNITVPVTFNTPGVTQTMGTFIQEDDVDNNWTDFRQFGNWTVPGAGTKPGPYVVGTSPSSGSGSAANLTVTVGHTSGVAQLTDIHIRMNPVIVGGAPCHVIYFANNTLAMINDAGNALVGPITPGSGTLITSRCSVNGAGVTRTFSGANVVLNIPFTFNPVTFGGTKNIYVNAFDLSGALTHWVNTGTWTVQ